MAFSAASVSSLGTQEEALGQAQEHECTACTDTFPSCSLALSPCEHRYCSSCIVTLFEAAIKSASRFPPKCCSQLIPISLAKPYLTPTSILLFEQRTIELETPNRTYCSREACNAFIEPIFVQERVATCQKCYQETCTSCKHQSHEDDCPEDEALQSLVKMAVEEGWQRCYQCQRIVERRSGCNHMTCRCNTQFCYICGLKWKTCSCKTYTVLRNGGHVRRRPRRRPPLRTLRGRDQAQQPMSSENANVTRAWMCIDISPGKTLLTGCRVCQEGKRYKTLYHAAAHLRRVHFNSTSRETAESYGDVSPPNNPPSTLYTSMTLLRSWITHVDHEIVGSDPLPKLDPPVLESGHQENAYRPLANGMELDMRFSSTQNAPLIPPDAAVTEHGIETDSKNMTYTRSRQLNCLHTAMPSLQWGLYTCNLCSGIVFMCDQCQNWACAACGNSTEPTFGYNFSSNDNVSVTDNIKLEADSFYAYPVVHSSEPFSLQDMKFH